MEHTQAACEQLRLCAKQLLDLKKDICNNRPPSISTSTSSNSGSSWNLDSINSISRKCSVLLVELKQMNREGYLETEERRSQTQKEKDKLDDLNLELQNLNYQKSYLRNQISQAKNFRCESLNKISLVSEEEFIKSAGDLAIVHATEPLEYKRELMINRLAHEQQQRRALCVSIEELKARKKALTELNLQKKRFLEGIKQRIQTLANAAAPIEQFLSTSVSVQINESKLSKHLPTPLYILYYNTKIFKHSSNVAFEVSIAGNLQQAIDYSLQQQKSVLDENMNQDSQMEANTSKSANISNLGASSSDHSQPLRLTQSQMHPLSVVLSFPVEASNFKLDVIFYYMKSIDSIVVKCEGLNNYAQINAFDTAYDYDNYLLVNLFPNDVGDKLHNHFANITKNRFGESGNNGRCFKWGQVICGIHLMEPPAFQLNLNFNQKQQQTVETIIPLIIERLHNSIALLKQLHSLNKLELPHQVAKTQSQSQMHASLTLWKRIPKQEYQNMIVHESIKNSSSDGESLSWEHVGSKYFLLNLKRQNVELSSVVEISVEYPFRPPIFTLLPLKGNFKDRSWDFPSSVKNAADTQALQLMQSNTPLFDNHFKDIETVVNVHVPASITKRDAISFLFAQIHKLQLCLDIIHNESADSGSKNLSGRSRRLQFE